MIKYSFIVPVYNSERYLKECLNSIIHQKNFNELCELIIIDDGSTDSSSEIMDNYKSENVRIYHQENKGTSFCRNLGLQLSVGEFICWVDSDDYIAPDYLESIDEAIESCKSDTLFICNFRVDNNRRKYHTVDKNLCGSDFWGTCSFIIRRDLYNGIEFPNIVSEDVATMILPVLKGNVYTRVLKYLYIYRKHDNTRSTSLSPEKEMDNRYRTMEILVERGKELYLIDDNRKAFIYLIKSVKNTLKIRHKEKSVTFVEKCNRLVEYVEKL